MIDMWCVYAHPSDYPDDYVARRFVHGEPTEEGFRTPDLETMRRFLSESGLTPLPRDPSDQPHIVETWI